MKTRLNIDNFSIGQLKNIGNTSLVDLSSLSQNSTVRIYAKLEGENPTGSIKDRVAKCLIFDAEKEGKITAKTEGLSKAKAEDDKKRLAAEAEVSKKRQEAIDAKNTPAVEEATEDAEGEIEGEEDGETTDSEQQEAQED